MSQIRLLGQNIQISCKNRKKMEIIVVSYKFNSNMTWFFSPIKSTDTNSALFADNA